MNGSLKGDREQKDEKKEKEPPASSPHLSSSPNEKDRMDES